MPKTPPPTPAPDAPPPDASTSTPTPARDGLPQARGALGLSGAGLSLLARRAREMHRSISDIPFAILARTPVVAPWAKAIRAIHDPLTDGIYAGIKTAVEASHRAATKAIVEAERRGVTAEGLHTPTTDAVIGALAGAFGDAMASERNPLTVRLGFYEHGRRLALRTDALQAAFPAATGRVVVFSHGLCCTEHSWRYYQKPDDPETVPYGERLAAESGGHGWTALHVRYNTGLHISQNGLALARQLERLLDAWPVPITELALVGHSMGGLVSRAAGEAGLRLDHRWPKRVREVICLGSPHMGAPLEQVVHIGMAGLAKIPVTRSIAKTINVRAAGIKDLRYGAVSDVDWRRADRSALWDPKRHPIRHIPGARYRFVGGLIGPEKHPFGLMLGDGLVRPKSSLAKALTDSDVTLFFHMPHLRLLNHPAVYALLDGWLAHRPDAEVEATADAVARANPDDDAKLVTPESVADAGREDVLKDVAKAQGEARQGPAPRKRRPATPPRAKKAAPKAPTDAPPPHPLDLDAGPDDTLSAQTPVDGKSPAKRRASRHKPKPTTQD